MQKYLIGLISIAALLVAGLLVGPSYIDWNSHKDRIAQEAKNLIGRDVTIDGDVSLALLPSPRLSAKSLKVANLPGGSEPMMAKVAAISMRLAFAPLLQGRIQVEDLTLINPDLLLEVLPDGRRNWDLTGTGGDEEAEDDTVAGKTRLDQVAIRDGRIRIRGANGDFPFAAITAERIDADLSAGSLEGPFKLKGKADLFGVRGAIEASLGRFGRSGSAPLTVTVAVEKPQLNVGFKGAISGGDKSASIRGRLELEGAHLDTTWRRFGGDNALLDGLVHPYSASAEIAWDSQALVAEALTFGLGATGLTGSMKASFDEQERWDLALRAKHIDLDQLRLQGEVIQFDRSQGASGQTASAGVLAIVLAELPRLLRALGGDGRSVALDLGVEAAVHRGQLIRQVQLSGSVDGDQFDLVEARSLLPGGSDIILKGSGRLGAEAPSFAGRVKGASDNFRALLSWAGLELSRVPASRLRAMTIDSALAWEASGLTFSDLDLRVDSSHFTGGIAVAPRDRLALGIGLTGDNVNLDAYWSPAAATQSNAGPLSPIAFLETFDANLDLKLGTLTAGDRVYRDLSLDATLRDGDFTVRQARIGDHQGLSLGYRGDLRRVAGDLNVQGRYDVTATDGAQLLNLFIGNGAASSGLGPVGISGNLSGGLTAFSTDTTVLLSAGEAQAIGIIEPLSGRVDLQVNLAHESLGALITALDPSLAPGLNNGASGGESLARTKDDGLALAGRLRGNWDSLTLSNAQGRLGEAGFTGTLALALDGPRPRLSLALATQALELDRLAGLFMAGRRGTGDRTGKANGQGGKARIRDPERGWSRAPGDFSWMAALDIDAQIKADAMVWRHLVLRQANLDAALEGARLRVRRLNGTLHDGALSLTGEVAADKALDGNLTISLIDVNLASLLGFSLDEAPLRGLMSINSRLRSRGSSQAAWIANMTGNGELTGEMAFDLDPAAVPGLSLALPSQPGVEVANVNPLAGGAELLTTAFGDRPGALSATFVIRDGVVSSDNLRLDGNGAQAVTRGELDLSAWRLRSRSDIRRGGETDSYLAIELDGPIDKPNLRITGEPLRQAD